MPKTKTVEKRPKISDRWPASKVEMWPLERIKEYPNNPKLHPPAQIKILAELMVKYGVDQPIVVDEAGVILKGHGRKLSAIMAGFTHFPVVQHFGLSEDEKRAIRIADNQVALLGGFDEKLMAGEVQALNTAQFEHMQLLGFGKSELGAYLDDSRGAEVERGRLLELVDVTIKDPRAEVAEGSVYALKAPSGIVHHVACMSPIADWPTWVPLLREHSMLAVYPGVLIPFADKAKVHPVVMVQPDPYIAGHIIDRWVEVYGKKAVSKV